MCIALKGYHSAVGKLRLSQKLKKTDLELQCILVYFFGTVGEEIGRRVYFSLMGVW